MSENALYNVQQAMELTFGVFITPALLTQAASPAPEFAPVTM
jgi:hypothetical protein